MNYLTHALFIYFELRSFQGLVQTPNTQTQVNIIIRTSYCVLTESFQAVISSFSHSLLYFYDPKFAYTAWHWFHTQRSLVDMQNTRAFVHCYYACIILVHPLHNSVLLYYSSPPVYRQKLMYHTRRSLTPVHVQQTIKCLTVFYLFRNRKFIKFGRKPKLENVLSLLKQLAIIIISHYT